jgi:PIN domain nuclease of toxin-antitoxin system
MKLLLDTHTFLWWDGEPEKLSPKILAMCQDPANELILSVASLWEIQIKSRMGKIRLREPLRTLVEEQQRANGLGLLPVGAPHVFDLETLPPIHKDPFDRIIVAQARVEGLTLASRDTILNEYDVDLIW